MHGHAIQPIGALHRSPIVRDDDEVTSIKELFDDAAEPLDVGVVQCRVHFVEQAEGRKFALKDAHQQCDGGHGFFATRQLIDRARAFARRGRDDLDTALEPVNLAGLFKGEQAEFGFSASKEFAEHAFVTGKVVAYLLEDFAEALAR